MVLGTIFLLGNTFCMAVYIVLQKRYLFANASRWASLPVNATAWAYGAGSVSMGFASLYYAREPDVFVPSDAVSIRTCRSLRLLLLSFTWRCSYFSTII